MRRPSGRGCSPAPCAFRPDKTRTPRDIDPETAIRALLDATICPTPVDAVTVLGQLRVAGPVRLSGERDEIVDENEPVVVEFFCAHYRYPAGVRPSTDIRFDGLPASRRKVSEAMAGRPLPDCAVEILAEVGLAGPAPA